MAEREWIRFELIADGDAEYNSVVERKEQKKNERKESKYLEHGQSNDIWNGGFCGDAYLTQSQHTT